MLWNYSLGCLGKFICEDVLKEAFPSANPDLLTIPENSEPVEEKVAEDSAKQGSSDDKEAEDKPRGSGVSSQ